jgi:class 3 adenylate cyclase
MEGLLQRAYERYPRRYAAFVAAGVIPFCMLATSTAVVTLVLVFRGSFTQFGQLLAFALPLSTAGVLLTYVSVWKRLAPIFRWLGGERDTEITTQVWAILNDMTPIIRRGVLIFCGIYVPFTLYAVRVLQAEAFAYLGLFMGVLLAIGWAAMMVLLWFDYALRPVITKGYLEHLPADFEPVPPPLSAHRKLVLSSTVFATANISLFGGVAFALDVDPAIALPIFVAIALLASFTVARVGNGFMARSMFGPIRDLVAASTAVGSGDLTTRVAVQSGDEFGMLAHAFNKMVRGLAEREVLHAALGSYVDPNVAERLLAEGELLDGEYVEVTVLFLDIRGFTTLAEVQDPAETIGDLNRLFGRVVPLVAAEGGHVNKFTGDGLLAVFGAPVLHEDHADRAVCAAKGIAAMMSEYYPDSLRVGVGINSGKAVAGTLGGGGHLEYAVIGDTVNVASRVEGLTRETGDEILLTGETKGRLNGSHHELEARGSFNLRGRSEPAEIYALRH